MSKRGKLYEELTDWMSLMRQRKGNSFVAVGAQKKALEVVEHIEKLAYERGKKTGQEKGWRAAQDA